MNLPYLLFTASIIASSITFAGREDVNEYFDYIQPWPSVPFDRKYEPEGCRKRREKALATHEENRNVGVGDLFPNEKNERARAVMLDAMLDIPPASREDVALALTYLDLEDYLAGKAFKDYLIRCGDETFLSRAFNTAGQLIDGRIFNQNYRFWIYELGFAEINPQPYLEKLSTVFGGKVRSDHASRVMAKFLTLPFDEFAEAIRVAKIEIAKKPKDFKGQMDIVEFMCGLARQGLRYIPKEEISSKPAAIQQSAVSVREVTRDFGKYKELLESLSAQTETGTKD